ncbi:MAG: hypothetical protein KDA96_04620, partial [Planctomycetaceae bacterium]|nr:hypothetical protein [Planctomycetaceae bacterium]
SPMLSVVAKDRLVVSAMTSTSCPLSKKYLPTLVELVKASRDDIARGLVNLLATDKAAEMQTAAGWFHGARPPFADWSFLRSLTESTVEG